MEVPAARRRPSLYITIRLARLVQNFRERLKARVKSRAQREALLRLEQAELDKLQADAHTQTRYVQFKGSRNHKQFNKLVVIPGRRQPPCLLLANLDYHIAPSGVRLTTTASHDRLLLDYDAQDYINRRRIEQASHVLDITTLLLDRLQYAHWNSATQQQIVCGNKAMDNIDYAKYLANLEYLLRCLQQAALDALIQHSLDALESDYHHWDQYLEQQRRLRLDWFTEWPSGQPPLSTTMPWNIKPSLMVLWGVCWMFYMTTGLPNVSRQTHDDDWAVPQPWAGSGVQNYNVAGAAAYIQSSIAPQQPDRTVMSHPGQHSRSRSSFGNIHGPVMSSADVIGSLTAQTFSGEQDTMSQNMNHMMRRSPTQFVAPSFQAVVPALATRTPRQHEQPATRKETHIRTPDNTTTAALVTSDSDVPFATQSNWQQQNPDGNTNFPQSHNDWQQPNQGRNIFTAGGTQLSYTQQGQLLNHHLAIPYTTPSSRNPSSPYTPVYRNFHPNLNTAFHMPDYPSPGSSASEPTNVPVPVNMPGSTSPHPTDLTSPRSVNLSLQNDSGGQDGQDPPRNHLGQIYCNHPDCAQNAQVFVRKCEWSKHMDKHTRPYICREPGCEKIRGFTYSGGLLRHEREVHRQHGGPKVPRLCPFPNCKRSTGQGFSRKENLNEHIRRVHRGADNADDGSTRSPKPAQQSTLLSPQGAGPASTRKRKRAVPEGEEEDDEGSGESVSELKETIKQLRTEMSTKDTRIRQLQDVITSINRSTRALQAASR